MPSDYDTHVNINLKLVYKLNKFNRKESGSRYSLTKMV